MATTLLCLSTDSRLSASLVTTPLGTEGLAAQFSAIRWDPAQRIAEEVKLALSTLAGISLDSMLIEQVISTGRSGAAHILLNCHATLTAEKLAVVRTILPRFLNQLCTAPDTAGLFDAELDVATERALEEAACGALDRVGGMPIGGKLTAMLVGEAKPFAVLSGKLRASETSADTQESMVLTGHLDGYQIRSRYAYFVDHRSGRTLKLSFDEARLFAEIHAAASQDAPLCEILVERRVERDSKRDVLTSIQRVNRSLLPADDGLRQLP